MRRRDFITVVSAAALSWPQAARTQQGERLRRVGLLVTLAVDDPENIVRIAGFREELEKFGWSEGRNLRVETRFARPISLAHDFAKELIALQPDVIVAQATPVAVDLKQQSHTIPIVFVGLSDPIGAGLVESLARPSGNLTGLMLFEPSVASKWLAMLKEIAPGLRRVAVVANPKVTYSYWLRAAQVAAPSLQFEIVPGPVGSAADIEQIIETFARAPYGGLLLPPDFSTAVHRELIIKLAAQHRLPAVYSDRIFVVAGGLMSYGIRFPDLFRQAAFYVDRILRGAKPADLPVQAPTKYVTALNLKTARAMGVQVPESMLVRADEVIE